MSARAKLASRLSFLILSLILAIMPMSMASAQSTGFPLAVELSRSAMEDYDFFELESADNKLMQAVQIVETLGISEPSAANIYVAQGVVSYGRFKDSAPAIADERTFSAFLKALSLNKDVNIPSDYRTSELVAILDRAKSALATAPKSATIALTGAKPEIRHTAIESNTRCVPMEVRAAVPAHPDIYRVTLHYSADKAQSYDTLEMQPSLQFPDELVAIIPGLATTGNRIHYFIEARDRAGTLVANVANPQVPMTTPMIGECEGLPTEEVNQTYGDPIFQFSVLAGTGLGLVYGDTENCDIEGLCGAAKFEGITTGMAILPFHLRLGAVFNLPARLQLGLYFRAQIVNIAKNVLHDNVLSEIALEGGFPEQYNIMIGGTLRWMALYKMPYRLYIGLEVGWGGSNASVFLGQKFNNTIDVYLYKGGFHIAPQVGFLYAFHKNVGIALELSVPIHVLKRPSFHMDLSFGPYFQF